MDTAYQTIKKASRWIPIKKWRHNFRNSLFRTMQESRNIILKQYAQLVTHTDDRELQKQILKQNVRLIEIEIASFCNRKCWFCPNSLVDRYSNNVELSENTYLKIIQNLAEISYNGMLNFHRFNEPLAHKDLILKRIRQAREALPNAVLSIFTNGDYLDRNYLDSLQEAGITQMTMSYYFDKNKEFDVDKIIKPAMNKMANKLQLEYEEIMNTERQYAIRFIYNGMHIMYRTWNPRLVGSDRGGTITDEKITKKKRNAPCYYPLREIFIDYNGLVMPCCNTRSDIEAHKNLILGDINQEDLFSLFMNDKFIALRKNLMTNTPKYDACQYCYYEIDL